MNIIFKDITKDNWEDCVDLTVHPHQRNFIRPNYYSLAEAYYEKSNITKAIYDDDTMIGFVMYEYLEDANSGWITRFMIDKNFQNKGYGKLALAKIIDLLENTFNCEKIGLSEVVENVVAKKLYESIGFEPTGEFLDNQEIMIKKSIKNN